MEKPFSDDEFSQMLELIQVFSECEMDQFAMWKIPSKYGDVFIQLARSPQIKASEYVDMSVLLDEKSNKAE